MTLTVQQCNCVEWALWAIYHGWAFVLVGFIFGGSIAIAIAGYLVGRAREHRRV
jgi:hypothetical protein